MDDDSGVVERELERLVRGRLQRLGRERQVARFERHGRSRPHWQRDSSLRWRRDSGRRRGSGSGSASAIGLDAAVTAGLGVGAAVGTSVTIGAGVGVGFGARAAHDHRTDQHDGARPDPTSTSTTSPASVPRPDVHRGSRPAAVCHGHGPSRPAAAHTTRRPTLQAMDVVALIPAYQEATRIAPVDRGGSASTCRSWSWTTARATRRPAWRRRQAPPSSARSPTRARARRSGWASVTRSVPAALPWSRSTPTASTTPPRSRVPRGVARDRRAARHRARTFGEMPVRAPARQRAGHADVLVGRRAARRGQPVGVPAHRGAAHAPPARQPGDRLRVRGRDDHDRHPRGHGHRVGAHPDHLRG